MALSFCPAPLERAATRVDVERDIRTNAGRIQKRVNHDSVVFNNWEHLNKWLLAYMLEREPDETKVKRLKEQAVFDPLPPREEGILCKIQLGPATAHGLIRISNSLYSVPDSMIGSGCRTVIGAYEVKISKAGTENGKIPTVIHPRKPGTVKVFL